MCLNTEYDIRLSKIKDMSWYPWIGSEYENNGSGQRLLIVGESHYYLEGQKESYENDKYSTRESIEEAAIEKYWPVRTYTNLNNMLTNGGIVDTHIVWRNIAYYNFCQRVLNKNERPSADDCINGWKTFIDISTILEPTICIFIGVGCFNYIESVEEYLGTHVEECLMDVKISNTYARIAKIDIRKTINLIGIRHAGKYFSWIDWREYINNKTNNLLDRLMN